MMGDSPCRSPGRCALKSGIHCMESWSRKVGDDYFDAQTGLVRARKKPARE